MEQPSDKYEIKAILCSVLCLDIVSYAQQNVAVQIMLKSKLNIYLQEALQHVPLADRMVFDTSNGVVVNFLGDVCQALKVLLRLQQALANEDVSSDTVLQLNMGLNLGPVRLQRNAHGAPEIVGDGLQVAQSIVYLTDVNQVLVSRAYCEAVLRHAPQYAGLFHYKGLRTDYAIREHELYELSAGKIVVTQQYTSVKHVAVSSAIACAIVTSMLVGLQYQQRQYDAALEVVDNQTSIAKVTPRSMPTLVVPEAVSEPQTEPILVATSYRPEIKTEVKRTVESVADTFEEESVVSDVIAVNDKIQHVSEVEDKSHVTQHSTEAYIAVLCDKGTGVFVDGMPKGRVTHSGLTLGVAPGKHFVIVSHGSGNIYPQQVDLEPGQTLFIKPDICN